MPNYKKVMFGVILLVVFLASGLFYIYTDWDVKSDTAFAASDTGPRSIPPVPEDSNRQPGERFPGPGSVRPGGLPHGTARGEGQGTGIELQITAYAGVFLVVFAVAYYFCINKKIKVPSGREKALMFTLLSAGLLLRIFSATLFDGHPFDINTFRGWAAAAAGDLFQFYSGPRPSDYPPLYIYVLFLIGKISALPAVSPYTTLLLKLPSMLADIAVSWIIFRLARKRLPSDVSVLLSAFYVFNPAVIINSTLWGQVDSFFTLIVVASLLSLSEKKIGLASALFTAAVLMKPQGIIFLPVLFFALVKEKSPKSFFAAAASALGTALVIILPFTWHQDALWIFRLFARTVGEYPYASVNAFNLFGLIGKNYVPAADTFFILSYKTWGLIFIVAVTTLSWFIYSKGNSRLFASASALLLIAGVFTFSTSMHERYLFPAAALSILAFIYLGDKRLLYLCVGFSASIFVNTHAVLADTLNGINAAAYGPILIATSLLNIALFVYLVKVLFDVTVRKRPRLFGAIAK